MDRNQAIGLVLISVILFVYFFFIQRPPSQTTTQSADTTSTIKSTQPQQDQKAIVTDTASYGELSEFLKGNSQEVILENENIKVSLNSQGGTISQVILKDYRSYQDYKAGKQDPLVLLDKSFQEMAYRVPFAKGWVNLYDLNYQVSQQQNQVTFTLNKGGKKIEHIYTLIPGSFQLDYKVNLTGFEKNTQKAQFIWSARMPNTEKDIQQSRLKSTINYYTVEDGFDNLSPSSDPQEESIQEPVRWIGFKQQFFLASVIAPENVPFSRADLQTQTNEQNPRIVKSYRAVLETSLLQNGQASFQYYLGPNKYNILNNYDYSFTKNIDLGWAIFGWVNKFLVIPVFNFLGSFISYYGLIIFLLVIAVRILIFPLSYRSYISMAKMRVLKPDLDALKEKTKGNQQKFQVEQMDLFRQVGINPLSGCIPLLLQMPVLIALFTFFPNSVELRQESFLWAEDLSTYDAIAYLPFKIPFYGDHVSLFAILMTASTIVYTWFNNQTTTTMEGPMKSLSYIMPVIFMFVLNSYSAGLSFYYFCSNIISIGQQFVIKRFVDEDKIKDILEKNKAKNKDKKKSGFQQRLEEAMKAQKAQAEAKRKQEQSSKNNKGNSSPRKKA